MVSLSHPLSLSLSPKPAIPTFERRPKIVDPIKHSLSKEKSFFSVAASKLTTGFLPSLIISNWTKLGREAQFWYLRFLKQRNMMYQDHIVEETSKAETDINTSPVQIMAETKRKPKKRKRPRDEKIMLESSSTIELKKEQLLFAKLGNDAELLIAILNGNLDESADFVLADLKNAEATQIAFTRRQGDKVISCLANLAGTLDQLCDLVRGSG